jgi:effector-binding domain-containing protein
MTVDFEFKKVPKFQAITASWKGPWSDKRIQREFETLDKWAKAHKLRTGRWVFLEPGDRQWQVGLEVKGAVKGDGTVRVRSFPAGRVAQVVFDPDIVSPRVVYHGLTDWLRWRKKEKEIRSVGMYREVYNGNPWREKAAWSKTTVQVVVRP